MRICMRIHGPGGLNIYNLFRSIRLSPPTTQQHQLPRKLSSLMKIFNGLVLLGNKNVSDKVNGISNLPQTQKTFANCQTVSAPVQLVLVYVMRTLFSNLDLVKRIVFSKINIERLKHNWQMAIQFDQMTVLAQSKQLLSTLVNIASHTENAF